MKSKLAFIAIFFILGFAGFCQEAVDLGLSVKWATCNVGANKPEEYGEYCTFDEAQELSDSNWRVPTIKECQELVDNCKYKWITQNGVEGGLFTSKKNGNSIFLPAAGFRSFPHMYRVGSNGDYWSSSAGYSYYAYCLRFFGYGATTGGSGDYNGFGFSVRLVQDVK